MARNRNRANPIAKAALACAACCGFVIVGLVAYVAVVNARLTSSTKEPSSGLVFIEGKDHPVTAEMTKAAQTLGGAPAPPFELSNLAGRTCSLKSLAKGKPLVLFFVELHCPCCKGAKPYIDRIKNYYGDVCNVVGIIDAKPDMAKLWAQIVDPQFDVLPDPDMKVIRAYKADRGTYTTLVAPGGKLVKAYPGYCQDMLHDITQKIARLAGVTARSMPLAPAPKRMTSGCIFPGTKLSGDEL